MGYSKDRSMKEKSSKARRDLKLENLVKLSRKSINKDYNSFKSNKNPLKPLKERKTEDPGAAYFLPNTFIIKKKRKGRKEGGNSKGVQSNAGNPTNEKNLSSMGTPSAVRRKLQSKSTDRVRLNYQRLTELADSLMPRDQEQLAVNFRKSIKQAGNTGRVDQKQENKKAQKMSGPKGRQGHHHRNATYHRRPQQNQRRAVQNQNSNMKKSQSRKRFSTKGKKVADSIDTSHFPHYAPPEYYKKARPSKGYGERGPYDVKDSPSGSKKNKQTTLRDKRKQMRVLSSPSKNIFARLTNSNITDSINPKMSTGADSSNRMSNNDFMKVGMQVIQGSGSSGRGQNQPGNLSLKSSHIGPRLDEQFQTGGALSRSKNNTLADVNTSANRLLNNRNSEDIIREFYNDENLMKKSKKSSRKKRGHPTIQTQLTGGSGSKTHLKHGRKSVASPSNHLSLKNLKKGSFEEFKNLQKVKKSKKEKSKRRIRNKTPGKVEPINLDNIIILDDFNKIPKNRQKSKKKSRNDSSHRHRGSGKKVNKGPKATPKMKQSHGTDSKHQRTKRSEVSDHTQQPSQRSHHQKPKIEMSKLRSTEVTEKITAIIWESDVWPNIEDELYFGRCIGEGSFAKVYEGYDKKLKIWVAIKVIKKKYFTNKKKRVLIEQEVEILAEMDHPNIIRFLRLLEDHKRVI